MSDDEHIIWSRLMGLRGPILVATNLSEISDEALQQGCHIAAEIGIALIVSHVLPAAFAPRVFGVMTDVAVDEHRLATARGLWARARSVCAGSVGQFENEIEHGSLNWRSRGRHSTVNPTWFMPWYFNFQNQRGLSFHELELPGRPASHACIRLLERDARWIYDWGEAWKLDDRGWTVLAQGTPVLIVGCYGFGGEPPWRSLDWLAKGISLPQNPVLGDNSCANGGR
jgi:hypothetical protein